ncbi:MAG: hypothetical protein RMI35_08100 [Leptospiraceae bacterium]|nr:hypothetical protein [Leptospiraceae bacterium]
MKNYVQSKIFFSSEEKKKNHELDYVGLIDYHEQHTYAYELFG